MESGLLVTLSGAVTKQQTDKGGNCLLFRLRETVVYHCREGVEGSSQHGRQEARQEPPPSLFQFLLYEWVRQRATFTHPEVCLTKFLIAINPIKLTTIIKFEENKISTVFAAKNGRGKQNGIYDFSYYQLGYMKNTTIL